MEIQLVRGKYVDELEDFEELGEIAQSLDIHMAIHAPYYMDFLGNGYMRNKSKKFLECLDPSCIIPVSSAISFTSIHVCIH